MLCGNGSFRHFFVWLVLSPNDLEAIFVSSGYASNRLFNFSKTGNVCASISGVRNVRMYRPCRKRRFVGVTDVVVPYRWVDTTQWSVLAFAQTKVMCQRARRGKPRRQGGIEMEFSCAM